MCAITRVATPAARVSGVARNERSRSMRAPWYWSRDTAGFVNLCDILELCSYNVMGAGTVVEALAHGSKEDYAVVLLDRKLPDESADDDLSKFASYRC